MLEDIILSKLLNDEQYLRKVIPFLKTEYFDNSHHRQCFQLIDNFVDKYNKMPSKDILLVELEDVNIPNSDEYGRIHNYIENLEYNQGNDAKWELDQTEKFCKDKALYNAIMKGAEIFGDDKQTGERGNIPKMIQDALGIMFETKLGHDYIEDSEERFEYYHNQEERVPLGIKLFDKITNGGLYNKSLNIFVAPTGVGKSLFMCHLAAYHYLIGKNVLYISMEMSEEMVGERIDANLLNIPIDQMKSLSKAEFDARISKVKGRTTGALKIHAYPTASAGAAHFRYLLNELRLKKNFIPDIIYIDYLNICTSSRFKAGAANDSYGYIKAVSEECRGLGIEFNVPIVTATQVNRTGFKDTNFDMDAVADSFGITFTADLILGILQDDDLKSRDQALIKQLKNRRADPNYYNKFVIGVDKKKMRLYDVELSEQSGLEHVNNQKTAEEVSSGNDRLERAKQMFGR